MNRLGFGHEHDGAGERAAVLGEHEVVEIGERHDQPHVVQFDEVAQRGNVARVVHSRDDRATVGVVERGCERIDIRRDRRCAGLTEGRDDVDALAGAREQNRGHEGAA